MGLQFFVFVFVAQIAVSAFGALNDDLWTPMAHRNYNAQNLTVPQMRIQGALSMRLNKQKFKWSRGANSEYDIQLPIPTQEIIKFRLHQTNVMAPELAKKYPDILTFSGNSVEYSRIISADISFSPDYGLKAYMVDSSEQYYIDPFNINESEYKVYSGRQFDEANRQNQTWICSAFVNSSSIEKRILRKLSPKTRNLMVYTFTLVLITNGEYSLYHGNTNKSVMEAIVATLNRVNGIYKRKLGISFQLHPQTDELFCLYPCSELANANSIQNQMGDFISKKGINFNSFDVSHSFTTNNGGKAAHASLCASDDTKAGGGVTGSSDPVHDRNYIGNVAHGLGHQLGGEHTSTGCSGNDGTTPLEYGSGNTIMAYAGNCGSNYIPPDSKTFFHSASIKQVENHVRLVTGGLKRCGSVQDTGLTPPVTQLSSACSIPINSYFQLGFKNPGKNSFFSIEPVSVFKIGSAKYQSLGESRFRSRESTKQPFRTFPSFYYIINELQDYILDEIAPSSVITITFRGMTHTNFLTTDHSNEVEPEAGFGTYSYIDLAVDFRQNGKLTIDSSMLFLSWQSETTIDFLWNISGKNDITKTVGIFIAPHDPALDFKEHSITNYAIQSGNLKWKKVSISPNSGHAKIELPKFENFGDGEFSAHVMIRSVDDSSCFFFDILPYIRYYN